MTYEILVKENSYKEMLQSTAASLTVLQELFLLWCSARIEHYLNRKLKESEYSLKMNVNGGKIYSLPAYPINALHSITVSSYGTTLTENTDFFVHHEKGLVEFDVTPVKYTPLDLLFSWTGGYTSTLMAGVAQSVTYIEVPEAIQLATVLQSTYLYKKRDSLGMTAISMPDGSMASTNPIPDLLPEVKNILKSYRRWNGI